MITDRQKTILSHIRKNPGISQVELSVILKESREKTRQTLVALKAKGCISWVPFTKKGGGIYLINDGEEEGKA
jgi:predicted HTH transcriptional regulator